MECRNVSSWNIGQGISYKLALVYMRQQSATAPGGGKILTFNLSKGVIARKVITSSAVMGSLRLKLEDKGTSDQD